MRYAFYEKPLPVQYAHELTQDELLATPMAFKSVHEETAAKKTRTLPLRSLAGHKRVGEIRPALTLAQGALAPRNKGPTFSLENALIPGIKHP